MTVWMNRAGKHGEYENRFLEEGRIYCTWDNITDSLTGFFNRAALQTYFVSKVPDLKIKTITNWISQVWPFGHDMSKNDLVVLPSKSKPIIYIGKITSDYVFDGSQEPGLQHYREVEWNKVGYPRVDFDQDILYSFGAIMTICRIRQEKRIREIMGGKGKASSAGVVGSLTVVEPTLEDQDVETIALDRIRERLITRFKGHSMAKVVDAILRAKGYITYVSPEGPDKGIDILAAFGGLGFESPRICVQVKTSDTPVDSLTLTQLIGSMSSFKAEYGLLVSWSGFKTSVERERANHFFKVRLWSHQEILSEFLTHYDQMDEEIKDVIPLKKLWVLDTSGD